MPGSVNVQVGGGGEMKKSRSASFGGASLLASSGSTPMTVWVGNLPEDVTEADLHEFFRNVPILSIRLPNALPDKRPCAYVDVADADALERVLKLGGERLHGTRLKIEYDPSRMKKLRRSRELVNHEGYGYHESRDVAADLYRGDTNFGGHDSHQNFGTELGSSMSPNGQEGSVLDGSRAYGKMTGGSAAPLPSQLSQQNGNRPLNLKVNTTMARNMAQQRLASGGNSLSAVSPAGGLSGPTHGAGGSRLGGFGAPLSAPPLSQMSQQHGQYNNGNSMATTPGTAAGGARPTWDSPPRKSNSSFTSGASWDRPAGNTDENVPVVGWEQQQPSPPGPPPHTQTGTGAVVLPPLSQQLSQQQPQNGGSAGVGMTQQPQSAKWGDDNLVFTQVPSQQNNNNGSGSSMSYPHQQSQQQQQQPPQLQQHLQRNPPHQNRQHRPLHRSASALEFYHHHHHSAGGSAQVQQNNQTTSAQQQQHQQYSSMQSASPHIPTDVSTFSGTGSSVSENFSNPNEGIGGMVGVGIPSGAQQQPWGYHQQQSIHNAQINAQYQQQQRHLEHIQQHQNYPYHQQEHMIANQVWNMTAGSNPNMYSTGSFVPTSAQAVSAATAFQQQQQQQRQQAQLAAQAHYPMSFRNPRVHRPSNVHINSGQSSAGGHLSNAQSQSQGTHQPLPPPHQQIQHQPLSGGQTLRQNYGVSSTKGPLPLRRVASWHNNLHVDVRGGGGLFQTEGNNSLNSSSSLTGGGGRVASPSPHDMHRRALTATATTTAAAIMNASWGPIEATTSSWNGKTLNVLAAAAAAAASVSAGGLAQATSGSSTASSSSASSPALQQHQHHAQRRQQEQQRNERHEQDIWSGFQKGDGRGDSAGFAAISASAGGDGMSTGNDVRTMWPTVDGGGGQGLRTTAQQFHSRVSSTYDETPGIAASVSTSAGSFANRATSQHDWSSKEYLPLGSEAVVAVTAITANGMQSAGAAAIDPVIAKEFAAVTSQFHASSTDNNNITTNATTTNNEGRYDGDATMATTTPSTTLPGGMAGWRSNSSSSLYAFGPHHAHHAHQSQHTPHNMQQPLATEQQGALGLVAMAPGGLPSMTTGSVTNSSNASLSSLNAPPFTSASSVASSTATTPGIGGGLSVIGSSFGSGGGDSSSAVSWGGVSPASSSPPTSSSSAAALAIASKLHLAGTGAGGGIGVRVGGAGGMAGAGTGAPGMETSWDQHHQSFWYEQHGSWVPR
ncbi:hypothetical protein HK102_001669 [Quaeritorhiza haematococci]|nr:hypothetical protein HK102_001669 [Quaeritorhiza haematococci]